MSIDSRYREQMELFCEETYKVGSEEMLEMAKNNSEKRTGAVKKLRIARKAILIPAAAMLLGFSATAAAGAAGVGPLSGLFTKYFGDSATKALADEGYIYTEENSAQDALPGDKLCPGMGETLGKGIFSAKVLGLAGDTQSPQMLFDIRVNEPDTAAASDIIGVYTLALGTDEFENSREKYGLTYSKGVKDEEDPALYHVSTRVPPAWVTTGREVVFDIVTIHTANISGEQWELDDNELSGLVGGDQKIYSTDFYEEEIADLGISETELASKVKVHQTDMQFRFTIPENTLKESVETEYDELGFDVDGRTYRLSYGQFGAHFTILRFDYDKAGYDYTTDTQADKDASEKFTLTVDGVTYKPDTDATGSFCDDQGICNLCIKDMCYMSLTFPAIDAENAESITLEANGVSYQIKPDIG